MTSVKHFLPVDILDSLFVLPERVLVEVLKSDGGSIVVLGGNDHKVIFYFLPV